MPLPEYWIADVNGRVLHQFWSSAGRSRQATIAGLTIATDRLG